MRVLGALAIGGMMAAMSVEAATSGAVFLAYLDEVLRPERCLVAEHCWDPVGLAVVEYAYRFERSMRPRPGGG